MATTTPAQGFPVPTSGDHPDIPGDLLKLANAIEKRVMGVYATTSARDAAIPTPATGQFAYITGTNVVQVYQNGSWVTFPPPQVSITSGTSVPTNATGNNGDVFFKV